MDFWKGKWLFSTGRATMIQFVLSAQPIYRLSRINLPRKNREEINRLLRTFFLARNGGKEKKIPC